MNSIWDIINIPMGYVIRFCNAIVGNHYVWALLLFAIFIEVILLPFGIKQQKNSIKQARLCPREMAIRKKYAGRDDNPTKQKMSMEIQELYQKEGYNPMGGCLPLLIQFPIIIALYNIVMDPLRYICRFSNDIINQLATTTSAYTGKTYDVARNIDLLSDMQGLSFEHFESIEGFTLEMYESLPILKLFGGAINLGDIPKITQFNWLLTIPVLTFFAYFFSMKMSRKLSYQPMSDDKAMGCSNAVMDFMMPLFSVYIAFIVPAAIGVYWIFKNLLGVVKQFLIKLAMPLPQFTEEDYKTAEKEVMGKAEKTSRVAKSGRVVRSLHHIDDEDFEDTAEAARKRREALEAQQAEDEANRKKESKNAALLKEAGVKVDDRAERNKAKKQKKAEEKANDNNTDGE